MHWTLPFGDAQVGHGAICDRRILGCLQANLSRRCACGGDGEESEKSRQRAARVRRSRGDRRLKSIWVHGFLLIIKTELDRRRRMHIHDTSWGVERLSFAPHPGAHSHTWSWRRRPCAVPVGSRLASGSGGRAPLPPILLHLGALVAVLLERRQLLDVRSGSSSSSIERLSLIMRWMRPAKVAGSSSEKPEVSSEVSKSRWTKSLTVLSPLSAATLDLSSCPDTN